MGIKAYTKIAEGLADAYAIVGMEARAIHAESRITAAIAVLQQVLGEVDGVPFPTVEAVTRAISIMEGEA